MAKEPNRVRKAPASPDAAAVPSVESTATEMAAATAATAGETPNNATAAALPIAVQMYTLRDVKVPVAELLQEIAAIGFDGVELAGTFGKSAAELKALLDAAGLQVASAHVALDALEADLLGVIKYHKTIGNHVLVVPWLPEDLRPRTGEGWRVLGKRLDGLGRRASFAGMRLLYHNHDFEMKLYDGKTAMAWLLSGALPEHLGFEPDIAWISIGRQDIVATLAANSGRVPRLHAKDHHEDFAAHGFADAGAGILDWDAILPAARAAGVEWLVVEHDHPTDALATIRNSYAFLAGKVK